jgi:hypothetical protein
VRHRSESPRAIRPIAIRLSSSTRRLTMAAMVGRTVWFALLDVCHRTGPRHIGRDRRRVIEPTDARRTVVSTHRCGHIEELPFVGGRDASVRDYDGSSGWGFGGVRREYRSISSRSGAELMPPAWEYNIHDKMMCNLCIFQFLRFHILPPRINRVESVGGGGGSEFYRPGSAR